MGNFLNSKAVYDAYKEIYDGEYFVDKSMLLAETSKRICTAQKYICITRPRRFGKSVMANMIAAFYSKGCDSNNIFENLNIAKENNCYKQNLNKYNVISITFNQIPSGCNSYNEYISRIENKLKRDLKREYKEVIEEEDISLEDSLWDILSEIYEADENARFIFVLDEWDFIFHRDFVTARDKMDYIDFLSNLLKDRTYVLLAYMTGILPIAKYSSGSELNMFLEYTMVTEQLFSKYFGFTESEVDILYSRYLKTEANPKVSRDGLRIWYNGYHTKSGERVYNPRSVVASLTNNNLGNYWTSARPYDEIYYYINSNVAAVRDDLAQMVAGIPIPAKIQEYAATSTELATKNEIFSAMVVYGFLSYEKGYVSIPNKELMNKFNDMLIREPSLGYLSARDSYRVEREEKAGKGFVDFIFYPMTDKNADSIILELKVDSTAEDALNQIKDRNYVIKLNGKIGQNAEYTGRVLGVGIAYDKKYKVHACKIEVLRERI